MKVIEVNNLRKEYAVSKRKLKPNGKKYLFKREKTIKNAVDGISFDVEEGETLAFIGPNGAGKSTTIKMLTGILFPTAGEVKVLGINPSKERIKSCVINTPSKTMVTSVKNIAVELLRRLKILQRINAIISVPPVDPPLKKVMEHPIPTKAPPTVAAMISGSSLYSLARKQNKPPKTLGSVSFKNKVTPSG